jgi:monoamine oxidase
MREQTSYYMELLRKGLGRYNKSTKCNNAIVGAGMAGLVAAWLLQRAGLQVRLYEASQRVGGRVRTLREGFSSGLYAEAGAMRIPAPHKLTLHLCKTFGLQLTEFIQNNPKALIYINGERGRRSDSKSPGLSEKFARRRSSQSFASAWASSAVSVKPRSR